MKIKKQKRLASIVIPVYKPIPDPSEIVSLKQAISVLHAYDFILVCPQTMNMQHYESLLSNGHINYSIQRFNDTFFQGIQRYSILLLQSEFYKRFQAYQYILIYQLDAYVFKDELQYWCNLGYDYIGAPLSIGYQFQQNKKIEQFTIVGNGGFSLRRVSAFIDRTTNYFPIKSFAQLWHEHKPNTKWETVTGLFSTFFKSLGYKNTMHYYKNHMLWNEDILWCIDLKNSRIALHVPDVITASKFSFEMGAEFLYQYHSENLPFGCHAWLKYDYDTFWKHHIAF
jgi:hypothetical protein